MSDPEKSRKYAKRRREMAYRMKCGICGKFCGVYPVGYYCDYHCHRCVCARCVR